VVLKLGEVTSVEACYQFLHEEMGAHLFVGVDGLELGSFQSSALSRALAA
jgi:hypothetical protein